MAINSSPAQSPGTVDTPLSDGGSWAFLDLGGGTASNPSSSSVSLLHSPASNSLASFGVVVHHHPRPHSQNASLGSSLGLRSAHESMSLPMAPTSSPTNILSASGAQQPPQEPGTFAELVRQHAQHQAQLQAQHQAQHQTTSFPFQLTDFTVQSMSDSMTGAIGSSLDDSVGGSMNSPGTFDAMFSDQALQNMLLADQRLRELVPGFTSNASFSGAQHPYQHPQTQPRPIQQVQQAQQAQQMPSMFDIPNDSWVPMNMAGMQEDQIFTMDGYSQGELSSPGDSYVSTSPSAGPSASPIAGFLASPHDEAEADIEAYLRRQSQLDQLQPLPMAIPPGQQQDQPRFDLQQLQQQLQLQLTQQQLLQVHQLQHPQDQTLLPSQSGPSPPSQPVPSSVPVPKAKASLTRPSPTSSLSKVRGAGSRVTKKKATSSSAADKPQLSTSAGSEGKFVVITPKSINSHSGRGSRFGFEGFETPSATQKGRKGPLSEEAKNRALETRRAGACFCCHARKVLCCDNLPCNNCMKLLRPGVPMGLMCWRFDNFSVSLFPVFMREHFQRDAMSTFIAENVASFSINGVERPCAARLSFEAFRSFIEVRGAKLFTPSPSADVEYHMSMTTDSNGMHLSLTPSAPIGLDLSTASMAGQIEKIKTACRNFSDNIVKEDCFVQQVTDNIFTDLPGKVLNIARRFYLRTNSPLVKQALFVLSMHFVMTHQLGLTHDTLAELAPTGVLPANVPYVTARLLNRQVKALVDGIMKDEVVKLFGQFARELKSKTRTAWGTCLAGFLVFCIFMEEVGVCMDRFVVSENEADIQNGRARKEKYARPFVVGLCRELESRPFRQFSYQFHNLFHTFGHAPAPTVAPEPASAVPPPSSTGGRTNKKTPGSRSGANAKPAFNPLVDDKVLSSGLLDKHALEMVMSLRQLIEPSSASRDEIKQLTCHPLGDNFVEAHPYPQDVAVNYKGRLCARFLLSFQDENYIFAPA